MNTATALKMFKDYQKSNLKPNTATGYRYLLDNFEELFEDRDLESVAYAPEWSSFDEYEEDDEEQRT